jgi:hypothetical protein
VPHQTLKLVPGVDENRTPALNEAAISYSNLIRFIPDKQSIGLPQKLGGWTRYYPNALAATPRALLAWADTKPFNTVYFNMMHSPDHMSIQKMTPAAQELVLNKLKTTFWSDVAYQAEIDSVIKFIDLGTGSDGQEFLFRMQQTDTHRKQNFMDTHPEIAQAMGYVGK